MKIAIDVQTTAGQKSGFGFYVSNLVENLKKIDTKNEYLLVEPHKDRDLSTPQRIIWDQIRFPIEAAKFKADIVHQPCFSAPILTRAKKVVTINDLISVFFPQNLPFFSRLFYSKWMPFSYRFADTYIAISEHTKKDIKKLLPINMDDVTVIYDAASEEFKLIEDKEKINQITKKYKINSPYIMHVGTLEPRKNLPFLVKVFSEVIKDSSIKHNLVIAGKKGWYYESLFELVKDLNLSSRVNFAGYISDEDMPYLYNGASLFTFPSLYEGFGLPPLEAMSCGTPVISSNTSSLPEVVEDAGYLVSPDDKNGWIKAIGEILTSGKIQADLSKKSLIQARKFSWEETARQTIKVYERLAQK
ncbi:MAG: glycosyltransferase family 1 protein [Patescibacteria group bacterium]|jgi:glycosyltransferase involved in cell wall biosynthesis